LANEASVVNEASEVNNASEVNDASEARDKEGVVVTNQTKNIHTYSMLCISMSHQVYFTDKSLFMDFLIDNPIFKISFIDNRTLKLACSTTHIL